MDQSPQPHESLQISLATLPRTHTVPQGLPSFQRSVRFLGATYSLDKPYTWTEDLTTVLTARVDVGRALYGAFLLTALNAGRLDLMPEHAYWYKANQEFFTRYVTRHVDLSAVNDTPDGHWLWKDRFRGPHPTVNYFTAHDILAVRLAWIAYRPAIVVPESKNLRKLDKCPDDDIYRACINPNHYEIAWESLDPAPNIRTRQGLPDGRTPKSHKWEADDSGIVRCKDCHNPMSATVQAKYARSEIRDTDFLHCPTCYSRRQDESGRLGRQVRGSRALRDLDADGPAAAEAHRYIMERAMREGKYNPAQEVPPQDEEYLPTPIVQEQSFQDYLREVNDEDI